MDVVTHSVFGCEMLFPGQRLVHGGVIGIQGARVYAGICLGVHFRMRRESRAAATAPAPAPAQQEAWLNPVEEIG